ncbi:hypothetical protein ACC805_12365 [Rhizobium ruizarguesonis]
MGFEDGSGVEGQGSGYSSLNRAQIGGQSLCIFCAQIGELHGIALLLIRVLPEPRRGGDNIALIRDFIALFRESFAIVNICLRSGAFDDTKAA